MFGRKPKILSSAETHPGALSVDYVDCLENSVEVARMWVESNGPATFVIDPKRLAEPEMFGMLMVDCTRHAARASQAHDVSEEDALERIFKGFDAERARNTTDLKTIQDFGEAN